MIARRPAMPKQAYIHDPENGLYDDSFRTLISWLLRLNRDAVPNFADGGVSDLRLFGIASNWLQQNHQLSLFTAPFLPPISSILSTIGRLNPRTYYILTGTDVGAVLHSVLCINSKIVHDPAISGRPLSHTTFSGRFFVSTLVPCRTSVTRPPPANNGIAYGNT